jgi:uncharacterized protein YbjT (DUF2867 family)
VLFLRPGYFMENTLAQVNAIRNFGVVAGPVRADVASPMIATRDIGAAAAQALLKLDFSGHVTRELHGQRDLTYIEVARIIGQAIAQPDLSYVVAPREQVMQVLTGMGASPNFAELFLEMCDAINSGHMKALEPRTAANTTPTSFETFGPEVLLPAYRGQAAKA